MKGWRGGKGEEEQEEKKERRSKEKEKEKRRVEKGKGKREGQETEMVPHFLLGENANPSKFAQGNEKQKIKTRIPTPPYM